MPVDRITEIRIEGMRVFESVALPLRGLSVLIGDNGSGKSTLLEAFELLRRAAAPRNYTTDILDTVHGPFPELVRRDVGRLLLGVVVEGAGPRLEYTVRFGYSGGGTTEVLGEFLDAFVDPAAPQPLRALARQAGRTEWFDQTNRRPETTSSPTPPSQLAAPSAAMGLVRQEAAVRLCAALEAIEYHPAFDVRPLWQQRELQTQVGPRWPALPEPTTRLRRYAQGLPAALHEVRNLGRDEWDRLIMRARAAVGEQLVDIGFPPSGAGRLDAELRFRTPRPALPIRGLSEGQLSFLALLAAVELAPQRSVLLLDEPDIHYHPELTANLVQILEKLSQSCPVVVATHSDRLLDALSSPEDCVILTEVDARGAAQLRRPNREMLGRFLARYAGLGRVRADGYEKHVFDPTPGTPEPPK